MSTPQLDRAFAALHEARLRAPELAAVFGPGTAQREALNALLAALDYADRSFRAPDPAQAARPPA